MSVRKICRKISRTGSSPGGKTLLKIGFLKKKETEKHANFETFRRA